MGHESVARVGVIVLNWNGWKDTIECLDSLAKLNHSSYAIFVVDNASSDSSVVEITDWIGEKIKQGLSFKSFRVLEEPECALNDCRVGHRDVVLIKAAYNGGYARGNNIGLNFALQHGAERIWILNNDTVVHENALSALEKVLESDSVVGIVGSILLYYDDRVRIQAYGGAEFNKYRARGVQIGNGLLLNSETTSALCEVVPTYISGASALVSGKFIEDVGVMQEDYFLYFEELDWAVRSLSKWRLAVSPDSLVYHKEGGSIGTSTRTERSHLSQYYLNRNLLVFYKRHFRSLSIVALIKVIREMLRCALKGDMKRAAVTMHALFDGMRGISGPRS